MAEASVEIVADEQVVAGACKGDADKLEELGNLCREAANRVVYANVVEAVAKLLSSECSVAVATQACRALANLCFENAKNRAALSLNKEALTFLAQRHQDSTLHRNAIGCIANLLSETDEAGDAAVLAGGVEALVAGMSTDHSALACRGLHNVAQKPEWALKALRAGAVNVLLANEDEGEDLLADLAVNEQFAVALAADTPSVLRLSELKWEKVLLALCLNESAAQILSQSEAVWRAFDQAPRLQGLLSGSDAGSERARSEAPQMLKRLQEAAAVSGEPEGVSKEKGERRGGALLALGNAARSDAAVAMLWQLDGLLPTLQDLLKIGTTHDQHLATGLLGNLAVPVDGRTRMGEAGLVPVVAACFVASNNAHVMMNCAVLLRRLSLHPPVRPLVSKELPGLLDQVQRLAQPEHSRVALELGRVAALCMADKAESEALSTEEEKALMELLQADWGVLRVEGCRGCAVLGPRCPPGLLARLQAILDEEGGDGTARLAAALALVRGAPASQELRRALEKLENDPTVVDGQPLARVSKQLLESLK